ncbi:MAG: hypothetical protein C4555_00670 [Dehalococcoidia bacterium]|jgi:hypothetical protein|nr:MAG: hypothetical protein C4555_00670 [Dehalococcoidia bacterium]
MNKHLDIAIVPSMIKAVSGMAMIAGIVYFEYFIFYGNSQLGSLSIVKGVAGIILSLTIGVLIYASGECLACFIYLKRNLKRILGI